MLWRRAGARSKRSQDPMLSRRGLLGGETAPPARGISSGNKAILESVERALIDTLGGSAEAATLFFMEKRGLKLTRLSGDAEVFVEALRAIFGLGSAELMKGMLKELRLKEAEIGRDGLVHDFAEVIERTLRGLGAEVI